jgi:FixJ family two-component response regulator
MSQPDKIVYVVDDDRRIREALSDLLLSLNIASIAFPSAVEYFGYERADIPACLILDVQLPGTNGLDLQARLIEGDHPPVVFITGFGDIPSSVRAIKAGAVDFLAKPFSQGSLIRAVEAALEQDRNSRRHRAEMGDVRGRFATLTPREREVLQLVVSGLLNKQAASQLGISEVTLQMHRSQVMRKMAAGSLAELVKIAGRLGIS